MKRGKMTIEAGLYGLAFLIGLLIRFYRLGSLPLGDAEASLALQALSLSNGDLPSLQSLTNYLGSTKLLFGLFEASPFLARFWPALIGSLLILVPSLYRKLLGKGTAVILAFGFALDGVLISASRQINGEILAVTFLLAGIGFFYKKLYPWTGICLAMALMSGPAFLEGLTVVLLILGVNKLFIKENLLQAESISTQSELQGSKKKLLIYWLVGTYLFLGTLFFTIPQVVGSSFQNIPEFLEGWVVPSGSKANLLLIALLSYELLPFIFGLIETVLHFQKSDKTQKVLNLWILFALLLLIVYPGRQLLGLVWFVIPLWALASRSLFASFNIKEKENLTVSALLAGLILVLLIFAAINLSALSKIPPPNSSSELLTADQVKMVRISGSLIVIAMIVTSVAWGWSIKASMKGLSLALAAFLFIFMLSSSWNAAGLGLHPEAELFRSDGNILEADLLIKTIEDHIVWNVNSQTDLETIVVDISSPSVKWAVRNLPRVQFSAYLPSNSDPGIIITQDQETLALASSYSGQNFIWKQKTNWSLILPREWLSWLFFRETPKESEILVVWVRSDLFPGAEKAD